VSARLRRDDGFGLVELLIAMTLLNVAVLAIVAAFTSGAVALRRASETSTASALADAQIELYRALEYASIGVVAETTGTDGTYTGDPALSSTTNVTPGDGHCPTGATATECRRSRTATGADGRSYRIDTYVVADTPAGGRALKKVTVVVRDGGNAARTLLRTSSSFDQATG